MVPGQIQHTGSPNNLRHNIDSMFHSGLDKIATVCTFLSHYTQPTAILITCIHSAAGGLDVLLERLDEHAGVVPEEWVKVLCHPQYFYGDN